MARTEWEIFYTTGRVLCFGALWTIVVLSLALSHVERNLTLIGWASVIGASLIFSTTTIPYKTPSLQTAHIDPLLFSVFTGIGIFLVSLPIMVYLLATEQQQFSPFAALGSLFIFTVGVFSYNAVALVGVSLGPAAWASVGMVTAFTVGLSVFQERVDEIRYACIAMVLLVVGIISVVLSKGEVETGSEESRESGEKKSDGSEEKRRDIEMVMSNPLHRHGTDNSDDDSNATGGNIYNGDYGDDESVGGSDGNRGKKIRGTSDGKGNTYYLGFFYCLLTGLVDGSLMVPYKLSFPSYPDSDTPINGKSPLINGLNYLGSFGAMSLVVMPAAYWVYSVAGGGGDGSDDGDDGGGNRGSNENSLSAWRVACLPGVASGMLWALANINSVVATSILNMSIAFPLTQTCCLWATLIGLAYFNETVQHKRVLAIGVACIIIGSFFLATSK